MSRRSTHDAIEAIRPFRIDIDDEQLDDLRRRLVATRWSNTELGAPWQQGPPLAYLQELCDYWATEYDWRSCEARLNRYEHGRTEIDGVDLHFIHAPSGHENATPVVLLHGWPGSIIEFLDAIDPLRDPAAHGGRADEAIDVVVPSLPGYGFSGVPTEPGWDIPRIARAVSALMDRLGYEQYVASGTDWGAAVAMALGQSESAERMLGIGLNLAFADPRTYDFAPDDLESRLHARVRDYLRSDNGYAVIQSTRPQTIGYALDDSPAGLAAWIVDKFHSWADFDTDLEEAVRRDRLLDNITLYWLTRTGGSSARLYHEAFGALFTDVAPVDCPVAYTRADDIFQLSEREARTRFSDLRRYSVAERGGHFLALEKPGWFVEDLRASVRALIG